MRIIMASAVVLGMSLVACAEGDAGGEGFAINRGALGSPPAADAVGARYIVKFRDAGAGAAALQAAGARTVLGLQPQNAAAAHIPAQALDGLRRNPAIEYIEEDALRQPLSLPGDVDTAPYGITMVQADQVTEGAFPVTVCIIDSGLYTAHEDHTGIGSGTVNGWTDAGSGDWDRDYCGHGTHVAGTIRGLANDYGVVGVNPTGNLNLYIVKVFGDDCSWAYSSSLVDALNKCRENTTGPLVVSMSLGGSFKSITEETAFAAANSAGVLSVAAAGNDGNTRKSYPGSYASVMSVAAVDSNKVLATFSQRNDAVDIAAPGVGVLSTVPWNAQANISVAGATYEGSVMEGSVNSSGASGELVNGGLCGSAGAWDGKVVLCQRGTYEFGAKAANAQAGGAVAVAIYNNVPGAFSGTLGTHVVTIPAISVSQEDGQAMVLTALGQSATVVASTEKPASGHEAWDGTSMATPHVSGVAALLWSNFGTNKTNAQIRSAIESTAQDLGAAGKDTSYGSGLVQAKAALDALNAVACVPSDEICDDGADNDCDGLVDDADLSDCGTQQCTLGQIGDSCTSNAQCCSNACKGKPGKLTCK